MEHAVSEHSQKKNHDFLNNDHADKDLHIADKDSNSHQPHFQTHDFAKEKNQLKFLAKEKSLKRTKSLNNLTLNKNES